MLCTAWHTSPLWPSLLFRVARWQLVCSLDFEWVQSGHVCVKHSDVFRYFKNKYCHALCNPSLSSFPRIKKKIPGSHNNIAENLKWFISWLIYFVITDLLVNSRIIFLHFAYLCYSCSEYFQCAVIAVHGRCSQSALIQMKLSVLLMHTHNDVYV